MFNHKGDFKRYQKKMIAITVVGLIATVIALFLERDSIGGMLLGFGSTLLLVGIINIIIIIIKKRSNSEYEEEMDLVFKDERLKNNTITALAYSGIVGMMLLALSNVLHLLIDVNLLITNIAIVLIYSLLLIVLKVYYRSH